VSPMLATATDVAAPVALIDAELAMPLSVPVETIDALFTTAPVLKAPWMIDGEPKVLVAGGPLRMLVTAMLAAAPVALARTEAPVPDRLPTEIGAGVTAPPPPITPLVIAPLFVAV